MKTEAGFEIDSILSPIAQNLSNRADDILDLREAAAQRSSPGRCLSCYFKLLAVSGPELRPATTPLRLWLEQHLEIVARDAEMQELERLPVQLDQCESNAIEDFCESMIHQFRYDRSYQHLSEIELSLRFKEPAVVA